MNDQSCREPQSRVARAIHSQAADDLVLPPDVSGSSGIGQRLRLDMDRLFRKGHTRALSRAANDCDARESAGPGGDTQPVVNIRARHTLNQCIADCLDLQSQCRQARWHLMDSAYAEQRSVCTQAIQLIEYHVNLLGERVVQLDGVVEGTARQVAGRSGLNEYPAEAQAPQTHIDSVTFAFWLISGAMYEDCSELAAFDDTISRDLLAQTAAALTQCLALLDPRHRVS